MAGPTTSDTKWPAANTAGNGLPGDRITRKGPKLRSPHVGRQRCGLQFLPHAIHRIYNTNPFDKFGSCCDARIDALPVGQTEASVIRLRPLLSPARIQRRPESFLRRKFLGLALDRIQVDPDAQQAQHPPVDPNEHGFPDTACIAYRLSHAEYRPFFELVWGEGSLDIKWPADAEAICSTPEGAAVFNGSRNALHHHLNRSSGLVPASDAVAMPVALGRDDRAKANNVFDHWGQSLHAFEASANVSPFSSKFDAFLAGTYTLTADEQAGYDLFRGKGNCNSCHLDGRGTTLKNDQTDTSAAPGGAPLFTCFGSANEGLPRNPVIPFYYETQPDAFHYTPNPAGFGFNDLGMGLFLRSLSGINPNSDWIQYAPSVDGQMQVSSARNAAMTPPNCPTFQKAFFHNGYVKSLKELVHFYNTRDVFAYPVQSGHCQPGTVEKVTCWPEPEVKNNMDMTSGKLGLSDHEEDLIVIFLGTLTDGFTTPYPDADKYTGDCLPPAALSPPPPPASAAPFSPGLTPPPL
jgi:cytochrome c peroxidase